MYNKEKDLKRTQEIKLAKHCLKLLGDKLPTKYTQLIDMFGRMRGYSKPPSSKVIYMIRNCKNGKMYIGQTESLVKRKQKHSSDLNNFSHENQDMQLDYIFYGSESFIFEIIEFLNNDDNLLEREKFWIKYFDTEWPLGYNCPYVRNLEYDNRKAKQLVIELLNLRKDCDKPMGKEQSYKLLLEKINIYKKDNNIEQWKTR